MVRRRWWIESARGFDAGASLQPGVGCVARPPFRLRSMSRSQRARGWRPPPAPVFGFPRRPQFWLGVLVGLAFSAAILVTHFTGRHSRRGTLRGANTAGGPGRVAMMGLPPAFGTKVHIPQHLDLFVDGKRVVVPAGIGI